MTPLPAKMRYNRTRTADSHLTLARRAVPEPQNSTRYSSDADRGAPVEVLKVSSKSNPNSVAGAIAGIIREQGPVEVQTVGAGALNQAVKAIAIARGFIAPSGMEITCIPAFADILIDGEERTAIRLLVEPRDMNR